MIKKEYNILYCVKQYADINIIASSEDEARKKFYDESLFLIANNGQPAEITEIIRYDIIICNICNKKQGEESIKFSFTLSGTKADDDNVSRGFEKTAEIHICDDCAKVLEKAHNRDYF